jgi:uncharacterized RmlC-like cupin family protein
MPRKKYGASHGWLRGARGLTKEDGVGTKTAGSVDVCAEAQTLPSRKSALQFLSCDHIQAIDAALAALGPFGEVRLIKNAGKLRFIQTVRSESLSRGE